MTAPIERLRAVLAAPSREDVERSARGIVGPLALCASMDLRLMQTSIAAIADVVQVYDERARALHPALLAVVEAADRLRATRLGSFEHGYAVGHLLSTIDALDAAIAAALPEAP